AFGSRSGIQTPRRESRISFQEIPAAAERHRQHQAPVEPALPIIESQRRPKDQNRKYDLEYDQAREGALGEIIHPRILSAACVRILTGRHRFEDQAAGTAAFLAAASARALALASACTASCLRISESFCATCAENTYWAGRWPSSEISGAIGPSVRMP